jgi:hypothetical protein
VTGASVSLRCLPVGHGDALLVEYGADGRQARLLIDGGPARTYEAIRTALAQVPPDEREIELLVVTHIDSDHIDGALLLLQDEALGLSINETWFNGWAQIAPPEQTESYGAKQGAFLEALLRDRSWNTAFSGAPIVVPDEGNLPTVALPGGAHLTVISPTLEGLNRLARSWRKVLKEAGMIPGDWQDAQLRLQARRMYQPPAEPPPSYKVPEFGSDTAVANGSSIALILEYGGRRILLAADAHPRVLATGLRRFTQERETDRVGFDAVKLPHHGSMANIDAGLLEEIDCHSFLVSTNGDHFQHPDAATIGLLGHEMEQPEVRFNYLSATTEAWADPTTQAQDGVTAVFPPDGAGIELTAAA